jgi:hypothetical protein
VKKPIVTAVLAIGALAIPAYAGAHGKPQPKPQSPTQPGTTHGKSHKCKPHGVAFVASGTLVSSTLTQTQGASTPTDPSDDRYSGTVQLNVTHTNHHAKGYSGAQTVTLTDARASWETGLTQPNPAPGTQVKLIGKITTVSKKCTDKSGAGTITYRKVAFSTPSTQG